MYMKQLKHVFGTIILLLIIQNAFAQGNENLKYNNIGVYPLTITGDGAGLGLYYEGALSKTGKTSVILPVKYLVERNNLYDMNTGYYDKRFKNFFNFAPGMKFYPGRVDRVFSFAFGPSLLYSYGTFTDSYNDNVYPGSYMLYNRTEHSLGFLANSYIHLTFSKQFVMGFDMGFGVKYLKVTKANNPNINVPTEREVFVPTGQFSFSFAYKF